MLLFRIACQFFISRMTSSFLVILVKSLCRLNNSALSNKELARLLSHFHSYLLIFSFFRDTLSLTLSWLRQVSFINMCTINPFPFKLFMDYIL